MMGHQVWRFTKSGWLQEVRDCLKPYWYRRNEITVEGDLSCPKKLQEDVLKEHEHIERMKANAQSYVWWLKLDK